MAENPDNSAEKVKRFSRKDISAMSTSEFVEAARVPYKRILSYIAPHKKRFFAGVLFGVTGSLFNGILLLAIRSVFTVVLPPDPNKPLPTTFHPFKGLPGLDSISFDRPQISDSGQLYFVIAVCLTVPVLILIRGLFDYLHKYCMLWVGNKILYQIRDECFTNLLNQSQRFYNKAKQGELMQTVFNQTRIVSNLGTEILSALIKHPLAILSILAVLLHLEPIYTLGALIVFPACILPVMHVSRKVRKAGSREEEEAGMMMVTMQECFSGIRVVKSHAREEYERHRFNIGSKKMLEFIMRWGKAMEIVGPLVETVASFGMAVGLVYAWKMQIDAGRFLVLNMALMSIYPHAKQLSRIQVMLQKALLATSKVLEVIDTEPDIKNAPDAVKLENARGEIELRDVTFSYARGIPALNKVSLRFEAGKTYALVGQSGAGKSTIMSLLMRFYDPEAGALLMDGRDIREYTQTSLRDNIGLVSQETFLFHDSIYNNIRYGRLDATREEIEAAARLAHAHEFIVEQKDGYNTELGDKGCTLSGGQQQRVSIARAILRNAPVLLLDEATSALDSESERNIQEALEVLSRGKTVIAIAHRLSTVLNSDEIVVMKDGRVLDQGPHPQLLERCGEYQRLYNLQFRGHESE
ncbi:MAG: ABC transporter ATP-binding protein [Verrucomicrobiae bacterium]|nr:ABC transporter ATP-binding protein [Verrucomicrobiae bacterium]MCP5540338.1 ABC transporter ATP-binding protein [Akkermansiaceae bacterium]MCP5550716.1 ABC transporter ATP-binding protein [Akkermansiaceae bacterium]